MDGFIKQNGPSELQRGTRGVNQKKKKRYKSSRKHELTSSRWPRRWGRHQSVFYGWRTYMWVCELWGESLWEPGRQQHDTPIKPRHDEAAERKPSRVTHFLSLSPLIFMLLTDKTSEEVNRGKGSEERLMNVSKSSFKSYVCAVTVWV